MLISTQLPIPLMRSSVHAYMTLNAKFDFYISIPFFQEPYRNGISYMYQRKLKESLKSFKSEMATFN